jgi:hypothetical protein
MKVLALFASVAYGYNYNIKAYNNQWCNGTIIGTSTTGAGNSSFCAPFNWTDPTTDNQTFAQFNIFCSLNDLKEGVSLYPGTGMGGMGMSNCSGTFPVTPDNATQLSCITFPGYPNVSFSFSSTGGINACAGFIEFEKALAKLLCISGDTAIPTRDGTVLAKDLEVGDEILTPQGLKSVQMFWHRMPEEASCLKVCSKSSQDCVTVSHEHYIRSSQGFETAETLSPAEFSVSPATCDGLVSFYVEGGAFVTKQGGMEISSFSKTWGLSHESLLWLTEWSGILMAPIRDWTFFAEASRCLSKGAIACALGSLAKLA